MEGKGRLGNKGNGDPYKSVGEMGLGGRGRVAGVGRGLGGSGVGGRGFEGRRSAGRGLEARGGGGRGVSVRGKGMTAPFLTSTRFPALQSLR